MSIKDLKYYLDNFDTDTLDSLELSRYLLFLEKLNSKRAALLNLVSNCEVRSYPLTELKWNLEQLENNISDYE